MGIVNFRCNNNVSPPKISYSNKYAYKKRIAISQHFYSSNKYNHQKVIKHFKVKKIIK